MGIIQHADSGYRKGVVLGLTMAEIVLLLTFLILLSLSSLVLEKENELETTKAELAAAQTILAELGSNIDPEDFDELIKKYHDTVMRAADLETRLQEKTDELNVAETNVEEGAWLSELQKELDVLDNEEFSELVRETQASRELEHGETPELTLPQAFAKIKRLEGQIKQLMNKLRGGGKGSDHPACWANPETGKVEYIFDIALQSDGFIIRDNALPHRQADQKLLPLLSIQLNKAISPKEFRAQTRPLFSWSDENKCRFFVRAYDGTGAADKAIYKERMKQLQNHFYRYEVRDSKF